MVSCLARFERYALGPCNATITANTIIAMMILLLMMAMLMVMMMMMTTTMTTMVTKTISTLSIVAMVKVGNMGHRFRNGSGIGDGDAEHSRAA